MSYPARVFQVLIASPSDVTEEREIAVRTIQEWNDLNSAERQLVLLPLRWETHSSPEYGHRPQEVLNRQVVDQSDLLVGVFWTRIGSPTGAADSGTLEEIERIASQSKPVMLYFSQAKQDPDRIDLDQLAKLREFKAKTFPKALVETYSSHIEFRDKLAKQLEIQIRSLVAEESKSVDWHSRIRPITDIQFDFAEPQTGNKIGAHLEIETVALEIDSLDLVPDYLPNPEPKSSKANDELIIKSLESNRDYYREMLNYVARRNLFRPVRFWLENVGGVGARDVYVDIRISSDDTEVLLTSFLNLRCPRRVLSLRSLGIHLSCKRNHRNEEKSGSRLLSFRLSSPSDGLAPHLHFL